MRIITTDKLEVRVCVPVGADRLQLETVHALQADIPVFVCMAMDWLVRSEGPITPTLSESMTKSNDKLSDRRLPVTEFLITPT